jgi:hypothetical protein
MPNSSWRGAVPYQVSRCSFTVGNSDVPGDLTGLARKLGSIAALGVATPFRRNQ